MKENPAEVLMGAAVLAAAVGFLVFASQSTGFGAGTASGAYDLRASFRSAEGIAVGTDIRLAGVKVGTVTGMMLDPVTFRAETVLTVQPEILVPADSTAVIASEGLLGGNFVEIMPGGSFDTLSPGDAFFDTQGSVSVVSLLLKFAGGGDAAPEGNQ